MFHLPFTAKFFSHTCYFHFFMNYLFDFPKLGSLSVILLKLLFES